MSNPLPYLIRMLLFLAAVAGLAYLLHEDLLRVFLNTPILNGVIVAVLVIGIFFVMRQVISLWPEVRWLRRFQHREHGAPLLETHSINLLAPMAAMLGERQDNFRLSPTATRALLDGIATRLDERRELTRYLIGLLIFLGLLGTFWGLLETIGAVADAINGLQVTGGDAVQMFAKLKASIDGPLKGKGGRVYPRRSGFCLETQHFPDSPNQKSFPSIELRPGGEYKSQTVFAFGAK